MENPAANAVQMKEAVFSDHTHSDTQTPTHTHTHI